MEAEQAHTLVSRSTELVSSWIPPSLRRLGVKDDPVTLRGIPFPNRIGLAAGFDKTGRFLCGAQALGFGFTEVGAVTPKPQPGHPKPRMWRYPAQQALRNKMGFNNPGVWSVARELSHRPPDLPVGVNLGKNAITPLDRALGDYEAGLQALYGLADFFVVNVSSPNTEGLRTLQDELESLLTPLVGKGLELSERYELTPRPLLVKLSPDLTDQALEATAHSAWRAGIDGFVAANTTSRREGEYATLPTEGGVSGPLLHERAVSMIELLRSWLGPQALLIGCGGVRDASSYHRFLEAGADLVQIYTGLVYQGPGLVRRLLRTPVKEKV